MTDPQLDFFRAMESGFSRLLTRPVPPAVMIEMLAGQAYDWFERNVEDATAAAAPLACEKGCPTCCALRVTATAPEIFMLAAYVRKVDATPQGAALGLPRRVAQAHAVTGKVDQDRRFAQATPCPLLVAGACVLHPVRALACRGHAAFRQAECQAAARGEDVEVAVSAVHMQMRGLVQNALQASLRAAGLAWGLYELNRGLMLALDGEDRLTAWLDGADSLGPAISDLDMVALAAAFDRLHTIQ
jgi:hypothetical protein